MRLWKFTARELCRRPGRSLLTFLSIAMAVAAVVAVSLSTAATRRAAQEIYESVAGRAAVEVVDRGGETFDQRVVAALEQTPGVAAAIPRLQEPTVMFAKGQHLRLLCLGIDPHATGQSATTKWSKAISWTTSPPSSYKPAWRKGWASASAIKSSF